jgi:hypothetical protein
MSTLVSLFCGLLLRFWYAIRSAFISDEMTAWIDDLADVGGV